MNFKLFQFNCFIWCRFDRRYRKKTRTWFILEIYRMQQNCKQNHKRLICSTCQNMVHRKSSKQQNFLSIQARVPRYCTCGSCLFNELPFKNSNSQNLDKSINLEDSNEYQHKKTFYSAPKYTLIVLYIWWIFSVSTYLLYWYHDFVYPMGTPRRIDVDSTWILRRYVEDQVLTNFHVISAYFFDVILMVEKSTSFLHTFFDVTSLVEKSTLFPRTFCDVISMVEKSMLFPNTFMGVISLVEDSTLFPRTFFDVISMAEKTHVVSTYFFRRNFDCWNTHIVFTYFFWRNFDGQKFGIVFGKL